MHFDFYYAQDKKKFGAMALLSMISGTRYGPYHMDNPLLRLRSYAKAQRFRIIILLI